MAVPYTFAGDIGSIPLSQLDSNFATPITIGSTPVALGSTATTVSGLSLNSPTLTTPVLGTPTSGTLTNCTGLPNSGLVNASITLGNTSASLGSTVATIAGLNLTNTSLTSPSLTSPTLTTPVLGTPSSGTLTNCTGLPNAGLVNSNVTVGSTAISLGGTATTVAGLTSLATNTLTSAASTALTLQSAGTTAITVDTSQNVGVGTTSPSTYGKLVSYAGDIAAVKAHGSGSYPTLVLQNATAGTTFSGRVLWKDGNGNAGWNIGQNVAVGNGYLEFNDGATNRMCIDSSGNLLVGTTNASLTVGQGFKAFYNSGTNPYVGAVMSSSTNTQQNYYLYSTGASAYRFYVGMAGTVYATNTTITAISDQRLKENIRDLDDGLSSILALKPRKFDWKEGKGADIKNARGFIAQEFETVFPDMIDEWKDPAPEGEEPYKAINANLIPTLVKAIQEQQALITAQAETINALTARVVALESKVGA
jgi:hypothetical protein